MPQPPTPQEQSLATMFAGGGGRAPAATPPSATMSTAMPPLHNMGGFAKTPAGQALVNRIMADILKAHGKVKPPKVTRAR